MAILSTFNSDMHIFTTTYLSKRLIIKIVQGEDEECDKEEYLFCPGIANHCKNSLPIDHHDTCPDLIKPYVIFSCNSSLSKDLCEGQFMSMGMINKLVYIESIL